MAGMPAKCDSCGHVFHSEKWGASGPFVQMSLSGFSEPCPKCGGTARIIEGTFRPETDGSITAISAPPVSLAVLDRLRELTERARESLPSDEELLGSVEAISPELAKRIAPLLKRKGVVFALMVLTWLVTHIDVKATIDLNQIFASAITAIEGKSETTGPTTPAAPSVVVSIQQKFSLLPEGERSSKRQLRRMRGRAKSPRRKH